MAAPPASGDEARLLGAGFPGGGTDACGNASWFSYATHHWASKLVHYGHRALLCPADMYALPENVKCKVCWGMGLTEPMERHRIR